MLLPFISGTLFAGWFLLAWLLLRSRQPREKKGRLIMAFVSPAVNLSKYEHQAAAVGWKVTGREFLIIIILALIACLTVSALTKNIFILIAGLTISAYLPAFLIEKKRQSNRLRLVSKLTNPLRILLSRIPDQQNITRALEITRTEVTDEEIRSLFDGYFQDMAISGSVREALLNMKKRININKCALFFENLILAHYEGFTVEACQALDKAIEALEHDLSAIEKVIEQNRLKKRKLYLTLGIVWLFPLILSFVNTTGSNIYLNSLAGQVLILFNFVGSVFVYVQGERYLSLHLDEL